MSGTDKPSVGNRDKDKNDIAITPKIAGEVMQVLLTGDPAAISDLKIDGAEEIEDKVNRSIYKAGEHAKPKLRRGVNKVTDTTLGTALEKGLTVVGGVVGIYVLQKGARKTLKKRKEKKLAKRAGTQDNLLED